MQTDGQKVDFPPMSMHTWIEKEQRTELETLAQNPNGKKAR